jgi:hypothetical protein
MRRLFPAAVECGKLLFAGIITNSHTRATPVPNDRKFFSMNEDQ